MVYKVAVPYRDYAACCSLPELGWPSHQLLSHCQASMMPSFSGLLKASVRLGPLKSGLPASVSITGSTGAQLLGYFSGWTSQLSIQTTECHQLPQGTFITPLTVFSAPDSLVTCDWVQQEVEAYVAEDDVFE